MSSSTTVIGGFRKRSIDKILAWDRGGRLPPVPIQGEEEKRQLAAMNGEAPARLLAPRDARAPSALSRRGRPEPLARLLPGSRPLAFVLRSFPGITDRLYRWVASHRDRWARPQRLDAGCELKRRRWP